MASSLATITPCCQIGPLKQSALGVGAPTSKLFCCTDHPAGKCRIWQPNVSRRAELISKCSPSISELPYLHCTNHLTPNVRAAFSALRMSTIQAAVPNSTKAMAGNSAGDIRQTTTSWPSEEGAPAEQWDAEHYAVNMRFVADMAMQPLIDLLAPKEGERILDLGCGDGPLMAPVASYGCSVVGVDYSEDMILKAREKGLDAHVADGQSLSFDNEFDAVFTNAALHWMRRDPDGVIAGVKRALKPGGRFVGEFGGHGNVAAIKTALLAVCNARGSDGLSRIPWYFPTVDEYRAKLEAQGFEVDYIELIPRPTPLPTGMAEWFVGFGNTFFEGMDEESKNAAVAEGLALLKPSLCDSKGNWTADYVRLRFAAKLKK